MVDFDLERKCLLLQTLVIGTGGFAHELAWHLEDSRLVSSQETFEEQTEIMFISKEESTFQHIGMYKVISEAEFAQRHSLENSFFSVAIGDVSNRIHLTHKFLKRGMRPVSIIHGLSRIGFSTSIGEGAIICPGVTIMPKVQIGSFFHAHLNTYIAHNSVIGDFVTLLPGAMVSGYVDIENDVLIGAGAIIKNGTSSKRISIGKGAVVGMGAIVTEDVPSGKVVVGNPARELR